MPGYVEDGYVENTRIRRGNGPLCDTYDLRRVVVDETRYTQSRTGTGAQYRCTHTGVHAITHRCRPYETRTPTAEPDIRPRESSRDLWSDLLKSVGSLGVCACMSMDARLPVGLSLLGAVHRRPIIYSCAADQPLSELLI